MVDNFIKKHGVPKTRIAMKNLVAMSGGRSDADDGLVELMGHVYFQVHSQQVNIRDKANGRIIVSIRK
ncbi:MAG: hypothetical protein KGI27_07300 [Thaumarchaeota archaeon]|nr:hypothetical protein [Nitrososphaerota archaeon]